MNMQDADRRLRELEVAFEVAKITHRQLAALAFTLGCEYMRDVLAAKDKGEKTDLDDTDPETPESKKGTR